MIDLVFPPIASPTCIPLGVSCLKAHIDSTLGPNHLNVKDLNIVYWNYLIKKSDEYSSYQRFTKGELGIFSREFYEPFISVQHSMKKESDRLLSHVRKWLDSGLLSDDIVGLFEELSKNLTTTNKPILFSCLFPDQLLFTLGFTKWLNIERGDRVYLGGASVLIVDPAKLIELSPWLEGVFAGEGELSIEIFIRDGENSKIPGLYKRVNNEIIEETPGIAPSMDKLSNPDFSWATLSDYFNPEPILPIQFSRGCKWRKCRFCAHNSSFGKYRCMDPIQAVDMLENYSVTLGANHFYITDQYLDATFLEPFAREIISRNMIIRYTFMGRPAEDMTKELLNLLGKSGCRWISWGVESGNARVLDLANKGTNPTEVARVLKDSSKSGIRNQALMIFGLPGSNDIAAEDTYTFLQENRKWIHSHTASEFQLYKNTSFGKNPDRFSIKVTGPVIFCKINGLVLESVKNEHTDLSDGEDADILRGPLEAKKWKRRGIWIYQDSFWNNLPSEHYLLLCSREWDQNRPNNPMLEDRIS